MSIVEFVECRGQMCEAHDIEQRLTLLDDSQTVLIGRTMIDVCLTDETLATIRCALNSFHSLAPNIYKQND
jgi:hypothetical protein